ncbi:sensor histidine kinase [Paenibacillus sp. GCM10023248]|uniref:cache domain-containing sensor histidine kinase n=1 Tax=unclassified Paenibacillus TaxID=185978 RepID=UPI0023792DBD|nr:sensor histidine kinase [Paenibacillus sp. MAHUQ-63]MDD9268362.1 sensor histidine kinase [Paenibacillus sp. MAHUQ-63]
MRIFNKLEFNYKNKLIITFVLVAFLPSIFMHYMTYTNSTHAMKSKINELVTFNLIQTNKNLDSMLSQYEDVLYQLIISEDVITSTRKILHGSDFDQLNYSDILIRIFSGYSNSKSGIRGFTYFDNNGNILASYDKVTGSSLWAQEQNNIPYLLIMKLNNIQQGPLITSTEKLASAAGDEFVFHIARRIYGISSDGLEKMGYIVMTLEESVLAKACSNSLTDTQVQSMSNANILIDHVQNIVSFPNEDRIGSNYAHMLGVKDLDKEHLPEKGTILGQPSIMNYYPNEKTGWTIVSITNEQNMFGEMYAMQNINIWTGFVMFLVTTLLIVYFSGLLTKSIHVIVNAMKLTELGNLDVKIKDDTGDEISIIASSYNKMMTTINELMRKTKLAVQKQKESEIRSLEAQINPHFLYNTLDSINWMAIEKEEHEISRMIKGLAHILRYSISHSNQMVPLAHELEWLEHYLTLQRNRFNDSFQYAVHLHPSVKEVKIYKLLLQPFIENTIIHGFAGKKSGAEIHIRIRLEEENFLSIVMEDNGCGMDESTIRTLMDSGDREHAAAGSGIGIRNVIDRLQLYYGDPARCEIESKVGEGTRIRLMVPVNAAESKDGE